MNRYVYKVEIRISINDEEYYLNDACFTSVEVAKKSIEYLYRSLKQSGIIPKNQVNEIPDFPTPTTGVTNKGLRIIRKNKQGTNIEFKITRNKFLEDNFYLGYYDNWNNYVKPIVEKRSFEIIDFMTIDNRKYKIISSQRGGFMYINYYIHTESEANEWLDLRFSGRYQGGREKLWNMHDKIIEEFPRLLAKEILPSYYSRDWID